MKKNLMPVVLVLAIVLAAGSARSHCEIPCGIYDDSTRIDLLNEHIATIDKSMTQIAELSAAGEKNYNQLVRWISNKDDHANQLQEIVTQYFLTQRIKPIEPGAEGYAGYQQKTELLHRMLVAAMKCKQTVDHAYPAQLTKLVADFSKLYFGEHTHQ